MPMKEFWNEKFASDHYIYGKEPNYILKNFIDRNSPGLILFPGEGEGRNAVYAASQGWKAKAIDQSDTAMLKALNLASELNVNIDYAVGDILTFDYQEASFDAIALIFFHLPEFLRTKIHHYLISLLKPNGKLLLTGFSKEQLNYKSGGPKDITMLYSEDMLKEDFKNLKIAYCTRKIAKLKEGPGHTGDASIIEFEAVKS